MTTGNVLHAIPDNRRPRPQPGDTWTGTAFAIDPYHLLTCEHVVDGANQIALRQQGYPDMECQVVLADEGSDTALLKVNQPLPSYLPVRERGYDLLGEQITTLGFPLTGLGNHYKSPKAISQGYKALAMIFVLCSLLRQFSLAQVAVRSCFPQAKWSVWLPIPLPIPKHELCRQYQLLSALLTSCGLNVSEFYP